MLKEIVTGVLMCTGGEIPVKSRGLVSLGVQSVDKTLCKETVVFNFIQRSKYRIVLGLIFVSSDGLVRARGIIL